MLLLKSKLHYTRDIMLRLLTNGGAHLCRLVPTKHSPETSQQRQAMGDTVSDLTGSGNKLRTSRTESDALNYCATRLVTVTSFILP